MGVNGSHSSIGHDLLGVVGKPFNIDKQSTDTSTKYIRRRTKVSEECRRVGISHCQQLGGKLIVT
jgi:hypothetical protein